jgi:hypothetical protein
MRTMIDIFNLSFILLLVYIICVYGFVQYQCLLCTSSAFNYLFHVWCDLKIVVFFCNTDDDHLGGCDDFVHSIKGYFL